MFYLQLVVFLIFLKITNEKMFAYFNGKIILRPFKVINSNQSENLKQHKIQNFLSFWLFIRIHIIIIIIIFISFPS